MNLKSLALVLIILFAGSSGGFTAGYLLYSPRLNQLESAVTTLQNSLNETRMRIESLEDKSWHKAYSGYTLNEPPGPTITFSDEFTVKGDWVRIYWRADAVYATLDDWVKAWIGITLRTPGGSEIGKARIFGGLSQSLLSIDISPVTPGLYYLEIEMGDAITRITMDVWDYY